MKYVLSLSLLFTLASSCSKSSKCGGKSKSNCVCTMQYDPVCGCDKKTYGNACLAECEGITSYSKGECK